MKTMKKAQAGASMPKKPAAKKPMAPKKKTYPILSDDGENYNGPKAGPREKNPNGMSRNGSKIKKAQDGSAFAKLAPPFDKATYADKIAGATRSKAKSGAKMKKAQMGADMMQSPMMKKGGAMKKCKYGCK